MDYIIEQLHAGPCFSDAAVDLIKHIDGCPIKRSDAIAAGALQHIVTKLYASDDQYTAAHASIALTLFCSMKDEDNEDAIDAIISTGAIPAVSDLLLPHIPVSITQYAMCLLARLVEKEVFVGRILIKRIVRRLYLGEIGVIDVLMKLSRHASSRSTLVDAGAARELIALLSTPMERVWKRSDARELAAEALDNLLSVPRAKLQAKAAGAYPVLVRMLVNNGTVDLKKCVAAALDKLIGSEEEAIESGVSDELLEFIRSARIGINK